MKTGKWEIDEEHTLHYRLKNDTHSDGTQSVLASGRIKNLDDNAILVELRQKQAPLTDDTTTIKLGGTWHVNDKNKLEFWVKNESGTHDILTFNNRWTIDKHHHITYTYEDRTLITKSDTTHTLRLNGYWSMARKNRLYYTLDNQTNTPLKFKIGSAFLDKNRIKYRLDIGSDATLQEITLEGKWRFTSDKTLLFNVTYGDDHAQTMTVGVDWDITKDITVGVKARSNDDIEFKVSADWDKSVWQPFVKYVKSNIGDRIEGGISFKF